jgi:sucrose phosphorylase
LIRLRNTHPAFAGRFRVMESDAATLTLRWEAGSDFAELRVQLGTADHELRFSSHGGTQQLVWTSAPPQEGFVG